MNPPYRFQSHSGSSDSESPSLVHAVSSIFSNSFGINPKTQQPYRLGPKTTKKRLALVHRLFLASDEEDHPVGYLFTTEIQSSRGAVGWIDSLAVLPEHRRKGVGTLHPSDTGDNTEWCPPHPTEPPPWWSSLENLSSQYEALLIVDKSHEN